MSHCAGTAQSTVEADRDFGKRAWLRDSGISPCASTIASSDRESVRAIIRSMLMDLGCRERVS
jgi:hypothetical protein